MFCSSYIPYMAMLKMLLGIVGFVDQQMYAYASWLGFGFWSRMSNEWNEGR